jgi:site-specific DNA recombinase
MKAVAYARYSSDNQRQESITAQLRAVNSYAEKNGINIIREYTDEALSGTDDDRPGLQRLIAELRDTRPQLVLVHKLDRFARNRYDSAIYRRELQKVGARLIAVDQPIDDSPEGVILEALLEGMAEYYSKNLAREVMKGMTENAYEAKFNGGWVPLGYDITPNKQYVINEHEADTIRLIFSTKLAGMSYGAIADKLNILGRKTKRGRPFGKNSIYEILRNEKYCGTYVFNETPKRVAGKRNNLVSEGGLEPPRLSAYAPQTYVSARSTTPTGLDLLARLI